MQLILEAVLIILKLFSRARGHLLFSNYSRNNLPEPTDGSKKLSVLLTYILRIRSKLSIPSKSPMEVFAHELLFIKLFNFPFYFLG